MTTETTTTDHPIEWPSKCHVIANRLDITHRAAVVDTLRHIIALNLDRPELTDALAEIADEYAHLDRVHDALVMGESSAADYVHTMVGDWTAQTRRLVRDGAAADTTAYARGKRDAYTDALRVIESAAEVK